MVEAAEVVVRHLSSPQHAGVAVKLTRSTAGVSLEVDVNRAREEGESYEECAKAAVGIAKLAYDEGAKAAADLGLSIGKEQKAA